MMPIKELLELRNKIKSKKPDFVRQDINKKKGLKRKWRNPRGVHSKLKQNLRGRPKHVSQGYRGPKKVRGMHKSGLQPFVVNSIKDLEMLDSRRYGIIISSSLGNKKKIFVLKKAKDSGFKILNIRNPDEYIKKIEDNINSKKKIKKEKGKGKKEVKTEKTEKKLADKVSEEERKKIEKEEKDKVLITKKV